MMLEEPRMLLLMGLVSPPVPAGPLGVMKGVTVPVLVPFCEFELGRWIRGGEESGARRCAHKAQILWRLLRSLTLLRVCSQSNTSDKNQAKLDSWQSTRR